MVEWIGGGSAGWRAVVLQLEFWVEGVLIEGSTGRRENYPRAKCLWKWRKKGRKFLDKYR